MRTRAGWTSFYAGQESGAWPFRRSGGKGARNLAKDFLRQISPGNRLIQTFAQTQDVAGCIHTVPAIGHPGISVMHRTQPANFGRNQLQILPARSAVSTVAAIGNHQCSGAQKRVKDTDNFLSRQYVP
jgi:hypothetical protein